MLNESGSIKKNDGYHKSKSNFVNITEIYKNQQQPSKFKQDLRKQRASVDLKKESKDHPEFMNNILPQLSEFAANHRKRLQSEHQNVHPESQDTQPANSVDFKGLKKLVTLNRVLSKTELQDASQPENSNNSFLKTSPRKDRHLDFSENIKEYKRKIRVLILQNIRFFNILWKTYYIDSRTIKLRYFYLYQDPSVDLDSLKKTIRDMKIKKESDVKELAKKLESSKTILKRQTSKVSGTKSKNRCFCCLKKDYLKSAVKDAQNLIPDYTFKDQIDIPLKVQPEDWFVFNPYSRYIIFWKILLYLYLVAQLCLKVGFSSYSLFLWPFEDFMKSSKKSKPEWIYFMQWFSLTFSSR